MNTRDKRETILGSMALFNSFFNPRKAPRKDLDFQFVFNEPEGPVRCYFSIRKGSSSLLEGTSLKPACIVTTDFDTWEKISGEYLSPITAIRRKKFRISALFPFFSFRRMYGGNERWMQPGQPSNAPHSSLPFRKVLILSCSPRGKNGATHLMVERLAEGMKRAGADITTFIPAGMKINPCRGCFHCWMSETGTCIYHDNDDMGVILDNYYAADLIVWATPVYIYHATTVMKTVMDRLFVNADPHVVKEGSLLRHPRKRHIHHSIVLLAVGGFSDRDIFKPLHSTFETFSRHTGIKIISELFRHSSMAFLLNKPKLRKKDEALNALEQAGMELIGRGKVSRATKKTFEQDIVKTPLFVSSANYMVDAMLREKVFPYERKGNAI